MIKEWLELEEEIGFNNARIVAHAVSWSCRPDNWRFWGWYSKLPDKTYVDAFFDIFLKLQTEEMSRTKHSDISDLIKYFNLPESIAIYTRDGYYNKKEYIRYKRNIKKQELFSKLRFREKHKS